MVKSGNEWLNVRDSWKPTWSLSQNNGLKVSFAVHLKMPNSLKGLSLNFASYINVFVSNSPFLYPLNTSENPNEIEKEDIF